MNRAPALALGGRLSTAATLGRLQARQDASGTAREHRIHVSATDARGAAAADLTPAEGRLREDGQSHAVVAAGRADAPMQVALLVDGTGPGIQHAVEPPPRHVSGR